MTVNARVLYCNNSTKHWILITELLNCLFFETKSPILGAKMDYLHLIVFVNHFAPGVMSDDCHSALCSPQMKSVNKVKVYSSHK